jgi:hypothetical protein
VRRAAVCALILVGLATACSSSTQSMKWHLANVRNYTWTIEEFGMAGGDSYTVRVVDGTPDISPEWRPFGIKHPTTRWLTVEDLFAEIDNAPGKVDVTYDDELGYPTQINFNPYPPTYEDGRMVGNTADDEWSLTVTKFEVNNFPGAEPWSARPHASAVTAAWKGSRASGWSSRRPNHTASSERRSVYFEGVPKRYRDSTSTASSARSTLDGSPRTATRT